MAETLYRCAERGHSMPPADLQAVFRVLGVRIEPILEPDATRAAELIAGSRKGSAETDGQSLSLGDGLCLAVAERVGLPVTGGDRLWESLELSVAYLPFR